MHLFRAQTYSLGGRGLGPGVFLTVYTKCEEYELYLDSVKENSLSWTLIRDKKEESIQETCTSFFELYENDNHKHTWKCFSILNTFA